MNIKLKTLEWILLSSSISLCGSVEAERVESKDRGELAKAALQMAVVEMNQRLKKLPPGQKILYQRVVKNEKQAQYQQQYVVKLNEDSIGQPVDANVDLEEAGSIGWASGLFADPDKFNVAQATLLRETENTWVLSLPGSVGVNIDDADEISEQKLETEISEELANVIENEVVISKLSPAIKSLHIFAREAFSPTMMATVDKFDIRIEYQEAWVEGPWISHIITRQVKGSYALFASIDEFEVITNTQFKLANTDN